MPTIPPIDDEWQTEKTLVECSKYMLEQEIDCDVSLLIGETKQVVSAHRFIMISRSPVFAAILCSPEVKKLTQVPIPKIEPDVFRIVLRFMYTDKCDLDADNVLGVLHAACKYKLTSLAKDCRSYISEHINVDNACMFLNGADKMNEAALVQTCFRFLLKNGEKCLKSESFCKMSRENVQKIIEADDLKACELSVWEALVKWAEAECERGGTVVNDGNIRQAMGDLVYYIRFLAIGDDILAKHVTARDILTPNEVAGLFRFCHRAVVKFDNFSTKSNRMVSARSCCPAAQGQSVV